LPIIAQNAALDLKIHQTAPGPDRARILSPVAEDRDEGGMPPGRMYGTRVTDS
jgi:hypothetical protein